MSVFKGIFIKLMLAATFNQIVPGCGLDVWGSIRGAGEDFLFARPGVRLTQYPLNEHGVPSLVGEWRRS